jgi:hypothetical protein
MGDLPTVGAWKSRYPPASATGGRCTFFDAGEGRGPKVLSENRVKSARGPGAGRESAPREAGPAGNLRDKRFHWLTGPRGSGYLDAAGYAAMPMTFTCNARAPSDPKNEALPKPNTPPSAATIQ